MEPIKFDDAKRYNPEAGWQRVSLAGNEQFSFEWFEKPPDHESPMHDHENAQVCVVLEGEVTITTEDDEVTLERFDSVLLEGGEPHKATTTGDKTARGIDVFAPGRSFDFWLDRED